MDFHLVSLKGKLRETIQRFEAESPAQAVGMMESKYRDNLGGHALFRVEETPVMQWLVSRDTAFEEKL